MSDWTSSRSSVVDGVAEVIGDNAPSKDSKDISRRDDGPCNWGGTLRNPCFWILLGVVGTLGIQYIIRRPK